MKKKRLDNCNSNNAAQCAMANQTDNNNYNIPFLPSMTAESIINDILHSNSTFFNIDNNNNNENAINSNSLQLTNSNSNNNSFDSHYDTSLSSSYASGQSCTTND